MKMGNVMYGSALKGGHQEGFGTIAGHVGKACNNNHLPSAKHNVPPCTCSTFKKISLLLDTCCTCSKTLTVRRTAYMFVLNKCF